MQWAESQKDLCTLLVFGSFSAGRATAHSDVDVAVLYRADAVPSSLQRLDLQQDLADLLQRDVDLIILNHADPIIAAQIDQNGELLVNKDVRLWDEQRVRILTSYAELKEIRKPMEEGILERRFYGKSGPVTGQDK